MKEAFDRIWHLEHSLAEAKEWRKAAGCYTQFTQWIFQIFRETTFLNYTEAISSRNYD